MKPCAARSANRSRRRDRHVPGPSFAEGGTNGVDIMRWIAVITGLALIMAVTAGCKQPLFLTECDYDHYRQLAADIPPDLDSNPTVANQPGLVSVVNRPKTVNDVDRQPRYISLQECIAIALETGTINQSVPGSSFLGSVRLLDSPFGIRFAPGTTTDDIRVLALDPAIFQAQIE